MLLSEFSSCHVSLMILSDVTGIVISKSVLSHNIKICNYAVSRVVNEYYL